MQIFKSSHTYTLHAWEGESGLWYLSASLNAPDALRGHPAYFISYESRAEAQKAINALYDLFPS